MWECPNCHAINIDEAMYCRKCEGDNPANSLKTGTSEIQETREGEISTPNSTVTKGKVLSIVQIILCVAGIILGIAAIDSGISLPSDPGSGVTNAIFGADFYTEIYHATQVAANNLSRLLHYITEIANSILTISGVAIILISCFKLCDVIKKMKG